jgi:hypothetical protein
VGINKVMPGLSAFYELIIPIRPNLQVNSDSLPVASFYIGNHFKDSMILGIAIKEHLMPLVC